MNETEAQLFARLKEEHPEFRRLAEKHREYDQKIGEFDRIYYLTSEQERKRKELQKMKLVVKDQMYAIMRQVMGQNEKVLSS
ncbi:MAG: YdcH family protein [candidate division NC10 bacterium]|nr:YdcH family protein [candidate division NC10 bacterium]